MKVLFIGLNWLGDIIMSLPAMSSAAGGHDVHILTRSHLSGIYSLTDRFSKIHSLTDKGFSFANLKTLKKLRQEKFDYAIVLPDSMRSAIMAYLSAARQIVGYKTQNRTRLLTRAISKPENYKSIHESLLHLELVKESGLAGSSDTLPEALISENQEALTFSHLNLSQTQDYILLAPGAAFGAAKRWPASHFADLAELISKHTNVSILITGSAKESVIAEEIIAKCPSALPLAGKTSLPDLAVLLSRARALVANDSGTMHLAALFSRPAFIPVGPTDMTRTGSLSNKAYYIYGSDKCPMAPCRQKTCRQGDQLCMKSISATMVFEKMLEANIFATD
jgi:heptosyltransferase-2